MLINEFYAKFTSQHETSQLFQVLRHVSRMEAWMADSSGALGWAEWPPLPSGPGMP